MRRNIVLDNPQNAGVHCALLFATVRERSIHSPVALRLLPRS